MPSPQELKQTGPKAKPANGGPAAQPASAPETASRAARGSKPLSPLQYVNAVVSARKRSTGIEARLLRQVPEADRERAAGMLKANDGK